MNYTVYWNARGQTAYPTPSPTPSASRSPSTSPSASVSASVSASASASASASGASASASPSRSSSAPGGATAVYTVTNSWPGGFQGQVTVTAGSAPINGWTVTWTFPNGQTITQLWNGSFTQSGATVSVTNAAYNGALAAGTATVVGFTGVATGTNNPPTAITIATT